MVNLSPFPCDYCGKEVKPMTGVSREFVVRYNKVFILPEDFLLMTCEFCGSTYVNDSDCIKIESLYQDSLKGLAPFLLK